MIRRFISILLIFSVNVLLLTHAVLPHHHHNGIPHFTFSLDNSHSHGDEDSCCCGHEPEDIHCCSIDQDIDVIHETKDDCFCGHHSLAHNHSDLLFQAILFSFDFKLWLPEKLLPEEPLLYITYCFDSAGQGFGLRAPPFS